MTPPIGRLRVVHVVQNMNYGGMERVIADLITHTDAARFELHLLCLDYMGRFSEGLERVADLHLAPRMSSFSMLNPSALAATMRAIGPDVVHTHSGVWYKASLAARKAGIEAVVHTEHGRQSPDPLMDRLTDALAARRTNVVVAVSERLEQDLPRTLGVAPAKIVCIPNGIDTELYRPQRDSGVIRRELGLSPDATIIGSIGRLETIKAFDLMLEAFKRFVETDAGKDAHLVIGGEGTARAALERLSDRLGVSSRVHLLGWRDDTRELLGSFTLFTMSSRSEGTSISLLEAMGTGLAPVVTDVGGNRAVLGDGLADGLVPFGNPDALAKAWGQVLAEPGRGATRGKAARRRVEGSFGAASVARAYEDVYRRAAGK